MSVRSLVSEKTNWWVRGRDHFHELLHYRFLLQNLVVRDLKVRYKNSILGVAWSMLNPLLMMVVFTLIFGVLSPNTAIRNYSVFFLVGLLPWNLFSGSLLGGTTAFGSNANLIKKVYFPRELLPLGVILSNLVNFLIAFLVLLAFLYASGLGLTLNALWVPVILLIQITFTFGLSLLLGSLYVFYRDIVMILDVVMLAWFFLTPVIYPLEQMGRERIILGISMNPAMVMRWVNPMASIIDGYRTVLWGTVGSDGAAAMDPAYLLRTAITAVITFIIGYTVFARTQHLFGEKL